VRLRVLNRTRRNSLVVGTAAGLSGDQALSLTCQWCRPRSLLENVRLLVFGVGVALGERDVDYCVVGLEIRYASALRS